MRGWVVAALLGAGWAATCVESSRRFEEDGKALAAARVGLDAAYTALADYVAEPHRMRAKTKVALAVQHVGVALEARARGFRGTFS